MIPLTNKKKNYIVIKKYVTYAEMDLVLIIENMIKLGITVITLENIEKVSHDIFNLRYKTPK